jgi:hypothetical protein
MKSGMTRWKMRPLKNGVLRLSSWVLGSVQGFWPVASPTKLATVIGVSRS